jgi:hypothetical protein
LNAASGHIIIIIIIIIATTPILYGTNVLTL